MSALFVITAWFNALFCLVALMSRAKWGNRAIWMAWALYVPVVAGGCVVALSGMRAGLFDAARITYYIAVAIAALGVTSAVSGLVTQLLARNLPAFVGGLVAWIRVCVLAWLAGVVATPIAWYAVLGVDRLFGRG